MLSYSETRACDCCLVVIMTIGQPFGFNSRAAWLASVQSTAVELPDAGLRASEFLSRSSGLQLGVASSTPLSSSVLRPRGLGLEMLEPHHPSKTPPNPRGQRGTERGRREQRQRWVFCCCTRRAPWPINRLFEFPPQRACHVSISEGLFLLPVRLFGSRGLSHISFGRGLLSGARQTVLHSCVRACTNLHSKFHVFSLLISSR